MTICAGRSASLELAGWKEERALNVVAIREGIRSAKATRGNGSIAIDVKEDSVAPWNFVMSRLSWLLAAFANEFVEGMNDVTTTTGCAISLNNVRRCSFNFLPFFSTSSGLLPSTCCCWVL